MKINKSDIELFYNTYHINHCYKIKYKNRYWRWKNNIDKELIEVSKDNKIWREPKGKEMEIIKYL